MSMMESFLSTGPGDTLELLADLASGAALEGVTCEKQRAESLREPCWRDLGGDHRAEAVRGAK